MIPLKISRNPGVTLVEIFIVVVILGILAAIVIPQFSIAAATSRENSIRMDLNRIRVQIGIYSQQNASTPPSLANFAEHLSVPINPVTSTRTIGNGAVGTSAWYYDETTGNFHANDSEASRLY